VRTLLFSHVALALLLLERLRRVDQPQRFAAAPLVIDYIFNVISILIPGLITGAIIVHIKSILDAHLPFLMSGLLDDQPVWVQWLVAFLTVDFTAYFSHWLRHKARWLWFFHAVHHSQRMMNPFTNQRFHPLDLVFDAVLRSAPLLILGGGYTTWFWFSTVDYLWGYFVHADLRVNLGPLKHVVVTPQYHRIHHSLEPRHFDKNFGDRLTIWDFLFGTMYPHFDEYPDTGLADYPVDETICRPVALVRTLIGHAVYPFVMIYRSLRPARVETETAAGRTVVPSV
jgi:sterol desaturase/sphingolipid hydroxylase (fatty acid hydroxylase superfamily)